MTGVLGVRNPGESKEGNLDSEKKDGPTTREGSGGACLRSPNRRSPFVRSSGGGELGADPRAAGYSPPSPHSSSAVGSRPADRSSASKTRKPPPHSADCPVARNPTTIGAGAAAAAGAAKAGATGATSPASRRLG